MLIVSNTTHVWRFSAETMKVRARRAVPSKLNPILYIDYQQVLQWGGMWLRPVLDTAADFALDVPDLPARLLYEDILPSVVKDLTDSHIPYHPGSPYGGEGWNTADPTVGDMHQWDVWAGKELAWQNYPVLGGRFIRYVFIVGVHEPWV